MKKRILSVILTMAMLAAFVPVMATAAASINIGDYVQMGTYYGEPILWRCVDIDENGPLMLSDKIICLKPFDAEGNTNTTTGSHSRRGSDWESNYWADSNMRSWLNSSASAGNVNWLCGNPPIESEVYYNAYDQEAGFLTHFSQKELNAVKEVTQKSLVSYPEYENGIYTTGSEPHYYDYDIDEVVQNYDTAYAEYVKDKMFLLDVKQVNAVYNNGNILGSEYHIGRLSAGAVRNSEYSLDDDYIGNKWYYWLRSPNAYYTHNNVRYVNSDGFVNNNSANNGDSGVRPAFYLNLQSAIFKSGYGTSAAPYTVEGTGGGGGEAAAAINKSVIIMKNNKDMTDSSDDYTVCKDAEITVGGKTYKTDSKGKATLPSDGSAKIVKTGYITETVNLSSIKNGGKIYLEKSGMKTPIIKSVTVNGTDIRHEEATLPADFTGAITAEIDWNGNTEYLSTVENGISVWQMTKGSTGTIALGKEFNSSSDISIKIKTTNGYTVSKKLKIKTTKTAADGQEIKVSFGDSMRDLGSGVIPYFDGMKFDFDIPNFPCEISIDGNKITGVFGVDVAEWAYENGFKDKKQGEWDIPKKQNAFKTLSELIKDTEKQIKTDKKDKEKAWKDLKKQLGKGKTTGKAKFGFDADVSAVGYIEGTIDQNGIYLSSGGIIVSAEAKVGISGQGVLVVVVVPVPYNWEASLKGAVEAQLAIAQREVRTQTISPQGTLSGSLGLKIGGGPGTKNVHANICGSGSLNPTFTFLSANRGFTLDATVGASLELAAWKWSLPIELAKKTFHLYPKAKTMSLMSMDDLYDENKFVLIGREYLDSPQEFTANDVKLTLFSDEPVTKVETVIKTNTYKYSQPKMVTIDGDDALLVWIDEDLSASTINGTSLMYSYYDGLVWSEPKYVLNDGMGDFEPVLKTVGDTAYLAWESAEAILDDDAQMSDMAKELEIKYAVYNKETGAFENITTLTNNQYSDYLPQISDVDGKAVVTWISNSENDIFTANNCYSVNYAEIGAANAVTAASGVSAVDSHCAISENGDISVVYVADTDGDISTSGDNELFTASKSKITRLTDDDAAQSAVLESFGKIYCYDNGILNVSADGRNFESTGIALPNDRYLITNGGKAVYYADGDGAVSDIYAYLYDEANSSWSSPIKQTELNSRISDISGYSLPNGKTRLSFNKTEITGDFEDNISSLFGQSNLSTIVINPSYEIAVDYAYADCSKIVTEGQAAIAVDIKNNGEKTVDKVKITLSDNNGNELVSEEKNISILPGNTETVDVTYQPDGGFDAFEGIVLAEIISDETVTENMKDNSYELTYDYIDVAVDNAVYVKNDEGEWFINAALSNNGLRAANNIEVCLIKDEETIDTKVVKTLNSLESDMVTFENVDADTEYVIEITALDNESMLGNNDVSVYVLGDSEELTPTPTPCFVVNNQDSGVEVTNTGKEQAVSVIIAEYDGAVLKSVLVENITFAENEKKQFDIPQNGKIFVWNSLNGMVPMIK